MWDVGLLETKRKNYFLNILKVWVGFSKRETKNLACFKGENIDLIGYLKERLLITIFGSFKERHKSFWPDNKESINVVEAIAYPHGATNDAHF